MKIIKHNKRDFDNCFVTDSYEQFIELKYKAERKLLDHLIRGKQNENRRNYLI